MTATTTGTNEQIAAAIVNRAVLEPPQQLETGTLVLLLMAAHSRSPEQREYYAPAVVLAQYEPMGEIDALVWDASAGNAFVHGYAIRDLGTRDTMVTDKDGNLVPGRTQYVIQSNIGQVLFSPLQLERMEQELELISIMSKRRDQMIPNLMSRIEALEQLVTQPAATSEAAHAASLEAKSDPKGQTKRP